MLWYGYYQILPKTHRHSLGQRIDAFFIEIMEAIAVASFLSREEKLLMVLWETKSLDNKKYAALSIKIIEIGKMLGGWSGQIKKQTSPNTKLREK